MKATRKTIKQKGAGESGQTEDDTRGGATTSTTGWMDEKKQEAHLQFWRIHTHLTQFLNNWFLENLGLLKDTTKLLTCIGLGFFATYRGVHFPDVTKQFQTTLEVKYDHPRTKKPNECNLHFKIDNDVYNLSIAQVCKAYGFNNGSLVKFPNFNDVDKF